MPVNAVNLDLDHVTVLSSSVAAMDQDDFIATKSAYGLNTKVYGKDLTDDQVIEMMSKGYHLDPAAFPEDSGMALALKNDYANLVSGMAVAEDGSNEVNTHLHPIRLSIGPSGELIWDVLFQDEHYHAVMRLDNGDYLLISTPDSSGRVHFHIVSGTAVQEWTNTLPQVKSGEIDVASLLNNISIKDKGDNSMSKENEYAPLSEAGIKFLQGKSEEEQKKFKAMTAEQRDDFMVKAQAESESDEGSKEETTPEPSDSKSETDSDMVTIGDKQYKRSELTDREVEALKAAEEAEERRKAESARITRLEEQRKSDQVQADVKEFMSDLSLDDGIKTELMTVVVDMKSAKAVKEFFLNTGKAIKAAKEGPIAHSGSATGHIGEKLEKAGIRSKQDLYNEIDRVKREEILPELQKQDRFKNREVKDFNVKAEFETNAKYQWLRDAEKDLPEN